MPAGETLLETSTYPDPVRRVHSLRTEEVNSPKTSAGGSSETEIRVFEVIEHKEGTENRRAIPTEKTGLRKTK